MLLFILLGLLIGTLGTLVGAGGGFMLVPILVFLYPKESADRITAISMAVVFFNALSGTLAYARMRRIDFAAGRTFALFALPGAILGAFATAYISRSFFELLIGSVIMMIATYLLWRELVLKKKPLPSEGGEFKLDRRGMRKGSWISAAVGFFSSILGIGGGIVHVPALVYVLGYPVHIATATSHFVLAGTSLLALVEHALHGSYAGNIQLTASLSCGAVIGAQIGARLSTRIKGPAIVICLAIALIFVSFRILWRVAS